MGTQNRRGAFWGLLTWFTNLRRIARLHCELTRDGLEVYSIRPVADGSYMALVRGGADGQELQQLRVPANGFARGARFGGGFRRGRGSTGAFLNRAA